MSSSSNKVFRFGPKVSNNPDADDDDCPSPEELKKLRAKKRDLTAILKVLRCDNDATTADIVNFVEQFWQALNSNDGVDEFKFQKTALWSKVIADRISKQLTKMSGGEKLDETHDLLVLINLNRGSVTVEREEHDSMNQYALNLQQSITLHGRIVLFSTTDVVLLDRLIAATSNAQHKAQLEAIRKRNYDDLAKLDGSLESARRLSQFARGVPLADVLALKELNAAKQYAAGRENTVALTFQREPFSLVEINFFDSEYPSMQAVEDQLAELVRDGNVILLDMRQDYYRYRAWIGARLTWGGDEVVNVPPPPAKKKGKSRKPSVKKQPQQEPPLQEQPQQEQPQTLPKRPKGLFEKGIHPLQTKLNDLYAARLPADDDDDRDFADAAADVAGEILRLSVMAYQFAFEARPLDDILSKQSGVMLNGANVFDTFVKPRLTSLGLDTSQVIRPNKASVDILDRYLAMIIERHNIENDQFDDATVLGRLTTEEKEKRSSYYFRLLEFYLRYSIRPLGDLAYHESRLRAALKVPVLGRVALEDIGNFKHYDIEMLGGSEKEKFDYLTSLVEAMTKYYVRSRRMFIPPIGTPADEKVQFTDDFAVAHQHAVQTGNAVLPRRLTEIFEIVGRESNLKYGNETLNAYLYRVSGQRTTTFYYTLQNGLAPGPEAGMLVTRDFAFKYFVYEETPQPSGEESEDDDNDDDNSMQFSAKFTHSPKYARFKLDDEKSTLAETNSY